jgi:non-ribosomal peptide synthetase component F
MENSLAELLRSHAELRSALRAAAAALRRVKAGQAVDLHGEAALLEQAAEDAHLTEIQARNEAALLARARQAAWLGARPPDSAS